MNLDGITLHSITNELKEILKGGQISKIYQLDIRSLYFRIFNDTGIHHLIITLDDSPRLYIARTMPPTTDVPTGLCMFLRKYFENGRIASIEQLHLDRLVEISVDVLDISGRLATRKIHVELMGKYSNVIFTENGIIIEALIKTRKDKQALRTIAPKEPYDFPPNFQRMDPFDFSAAELTDMMLPGTEEPLDKWMLKRFNGMSTVVLNELAWRTGLDIKKPVGQLSPADQFTWCRAVEALGKQLQHLSGAYIYTVKGKEIIFPLELQSLDAYPRRHTACIEDYLDAFQSTHRSLNGEQEQMQKKVAKLIEKQKRKIKRVQAELKETAKMDTYKLYGDLLMIYAYEKHDHEKSLTVANLLSEQQEPITIPLDPAYSMTDNANRYYKRYTKLRNRKQKSAELQEENQSHLNYLLSLEYALENTASKDEIADIKAEMKQMRLLPASGRDKLKKDSAQHILTVDDDGIPVWVGRNNRQNDYLTTKKAHPYDLWFHIKNQPGSHVILACHNQKPTEAQILKAAQLAAYYSKSRNSSKAEVDCTLVRRVKKPAHAAPGFVIFEGQTTYMVEPKNWCQKEHAATDAGADGK
ncbi:NFACT family protein [uncultured Megasphaera sp.]|uniref:Rqc2 family fibronectin-binding protein n=1 Tax=uncultured Megasphaera sp. TaxID=165188 RepID=UPI00265B148F|nr:NFACT family protein [uncultured Megasphaera sp.]